MGYIPNKALAFTTLCSWGLILTISVVDGFLYGAPPVDSILPPLAGALIGWFALIVTILSVIKLMLTPDQRASEVL